MRADEPKFTIVYANPAYLKITGTQSEDIEGQGFMEAFPENPDDQQTHNVRSLLDCLTKTTRGKCQTVMDGQRYDIPIRGTDRFDTRYWTATNSPLMDEEGNVEYIIHVTLDITGAYELAKRERIAAEVAQGQREELNILFRNAPVALATFIGRDFVIDMFNNMVLEFWGRTADQVQNVPLFKALPEASGQGFEELLTNVYNTGERFVANEQPVTLLRNGELEDCRINFIYEPIRDIAGTVNGIMVVCVEVTEQVKARERIEALNVQLSTTLGKLTESEQRFRAMADDADLLIDIMDETGEVVYVNPAFEKYLGWPGDQWLGKGFLDFIHPEDKEQFVEHFENAFAARQVFRGSIRIRKSDGQYRWLMFSVVPRFDDDGSFAGCISSSLDITEQKQEEQRKNDFISMVSHELKTPLTSINGYHQILLSKIAKNEDPAATEMLKKATVQTGRMTSLINGFLNISRLESGQLYIDKKPFNASALLREIEEEAESMSTSHIVKFEVDKELGITADREKIGQVIRNFISNAFKYAPAGTLIHVSALMKQENFFVSVSNAGIGITTEDLPHVFKRFYRSKALEEKHISGLGIGLYLCKEIVDRHHGEIGVESNYNSGSKFWFSLPVDDI